MNPNDFNLAPISINAKSALNLGSMSIQSTPSYPDNFSQLQQRGNFLITD